MRKLGLLGIIAILSISLTGCKDKLYEVKGIIDEVECESEQSSNSSRYHDSKITLDNGVTYFTNDDLGCNFSEGVEVTIIHKESLKIIRILVEGTKEYGDTN